MLELLGKLPDDILDEAADAGDRKAFERLEGPQEDAGTSQPLRAARRSRRVILWMRRHSVVLAACLCLAILGALWQSAGSRLWNEMSGGEGMGGADIDSDGAQGETAAGDPVEAGGGEMPPCTDSGQSPAGGMEGECSGQSPAGGMEGECSGQSPAGGTAGAGSDQSSAGGTAGAGSGQSPAGGTAGAGSDQVGGAIASNSGQGPENGAVGSESGVQQAGGLDGVEGMDGLPQGEMNGGEGSSMGFWYEGVRYEDAGQPVAAKPGQDWHPVGKLCFAQRAESPDDEQNVGGELAAEETAGQAAGSGQAAGVFSDWETADEELNGCDVYKTSGGVFYVELPDGYHLFCQNYY